MRPVLSALRLWTPRRFAGAALASGVAAVALGVPTDLIDTPFVSRPIAITTWSYPLWIVTSLLIGMLLAASFGGRDHNRSVAGGGLLTIFAMGCPVCNKPILLLLGASGALEIWAPLQPVVGALAVVLLSVALVVALRASVGCRVAPFVARARA